MGLNDEIKNAVNWDAPSVDMSEKLRTAIQKMVDSCASALAVTSGGEVVGVLTEMDVMMSIDRNNDLDGIQVRNCMTACELLKGEGVKSPCAQLDSTQSVENALGVMSRAGVHHLMVSDEENKCVGVVSILNLLKQAIS